MKIYSVKIENKEEEYEYTDTIHVCNNHSLAITKMEQAALVALEKARRSIANELYLEPGTDSVEIIEKRPITNAAWKVKYGEFFESPLIRFWVTEYEIETE